VSKPASSILQFIQGLRGELHVTWEEGTGRLGSTIVAAASNASAGLRSAVVAHRFWRCSDSRGESIHSLGVPVCCHAAPSLRVNPMPPRITQKNHKPRTYSSPAASWQQPVNGQAVVGREIYLAVRDCRYGELSRYPRIITSCVFCTVVQFPSQI
jgi:hypothetical protein